MSVSEKDIKKSAMNKQNTKNANRKNKSQDIPEKKKAAIGVRGMKMGDKDYLEKVYYTQNGTENVIKYKGKKMELNKLKLNKRDSKGTKVRV